MADWLVLVLACSIEEQHENGSTWTKQIWLSVQKLFLSSNLYLGLGILSSNIVERLPLNLNILLIVWDLLGQRSRPCWSSRVKKLEGLIFCWINFANVILSGYASWLLKNTYISLNLKVSFFSLSLSFFIANLQSNEQVINKKMSDLSFFL